MNIETTEDLAEQIADWLGIYGGCKNITGDDDLCTYNKNKPFCCRQGFCGAMKERMTEAVENEKKLEALNLKQNTMTKFKSKEVECLFEKINEGLWEYRKDYAMYLTKKIIKSILTAIWAVTIFPLILLWMFIMDRGCSPILNEGESKNK